MTEIMLGGAEAVGTTSQTLTLVLVPQLKSISYRFGTHLHGWEKDAHGKQTLQKNPQPLL